MRVPKQRTISTDCERAYSDMHVTAPAKLPHAGETCKLEFGKLEMEIGNWKLDGTYRHRKLETGNGIWKLESGKWKVESGTAPIGHRSYQVSIQ